MTDDDRVQPVQAYDFLSLDIRDFIARTAGFDPPPGTLEAPGGIAAVRAGYDAMCRAFDSPRPPGQEVRDLTLAGVPCRLYRPATAPAAADAPVGVYLHGGGFVLGGLHSHDSICADLAQAAGLALVAVDYRLAPEHPHPAAFRDACAVVDALPGAKLVIGDSAGGTLAAAVAAHRPAAGIRGQVLIYPGLGGGAAAPSMRRHARAPLLSADDVLGYQAARGSGVPATDPAALPLTAARFTGLPPSAIFAAECDPLASDSALYAARLVAAGVPAQLTVEPELVHGYLRARHCTRAGRDAFARIAAATARLAGLTGAN